MSILTTRAGDVFATTLHTAGAIGFLAGLMVYVAWARGARRGDAHPNLLALGATLTYISILANLLGGFIRTYQPGHPKFWELFAEPWALIMVVKHLVLFAGMYAAVYLFEVQAPRLRRALGEGRLSEHDQRNHRRERGHVGITAASILIASLLGAVTAVTPIGAEPMDDDPPSPVDEPFLGAADTFSGTITGTPLPQLQETARGTFSVPAGARGLEATLNLDQAAATTLVITAPDGTTTSGQTTLQGATTLTLMPDAAPPGSWSFALTATTGANVEWRIDIMVAGAVATYLEETVVVPAGAFFEINTDMAVGENMAWDWASPDHLAFNVHTHFDGEVQYLVETHTEAHSGNLTAQRAGGHSLMWENTGAAAIELSYRAWGDFEVDSYYPAR